MALFKIMTT